MAEAAVLNWVLFLPLVGVAALAVVPADHGRLVRTLSLTVMVVQLALVAWLYSRFDPSVGGLQFETRLPWIEAWRVGEPPGPQNAPKVVRMLLEDLRVMTEASVSVNANRKDQ